MPKTKAIEPHTVGGRLRAARQRQRLTLAKVGEHAGVSAQAVAQWEYGEAEPSIAKLRILAQLLQFELADVLGISTEQHNIGLDELSKRLKQILEILPTAQPMIIDTSVSRPGMDGVYLVRLPGDDRRVVLGRVVWPQQSVENKNRKGSAMGKAGGGGVK